MIFQILAKQKLLFSLFILILCAFALFFCLRSKKAIKLKKYTFEENCYLCIPTSVTGYSWALINEVNKPLYDFGRNPVPQDYSQKLVTLEGNKPDNFLNSNLFSSYENKFIICGNLINSDSSLDPVNFISNENAEDILYVEKWEICYPVMRDGFLDILNPFHSGLFTFDFIKKE